MEHLQREWHANREHLFFWTPGSAPFRDLLMFQLFRQIFPNLPCLFSTFLLEYLSVLSRFCFLVNKTYEIVLKFCWYYRLCLVWKRCIIFKCNPNIKIYRYSLSQLDQRWEWVATVNSRITIILAHFFNVLSALVMLAVYYDVEHWQCLLFIINHWRCLAMFVVYYSALSMLVVYCDIELGNVCYVYYDI